MNSSAKPTLGQQKAVPKRVLQLMFYQGLVTISAREGMVKTYDLLTRHFGWEKLPRPATDRQITTYLLDRALRSQGVVSLDSICHLAASRKPAVRELTEARVRRKLLVPVTIAGAEKVAHWATPETLEQPHAQAGRVHILSPFDPLIIQHKQLKLFFGYDHLFEAYVRRKSARSATSPYRCCWETVWWLPSTSRQIGVRGVSWYRTGAGLPIGHRSQSRYRSGDARLRAVPVRPADPRLTGSLSIPRRAR